MERAITLIKDKSTLDGLKLVFRQFNDVLGSLDVSEIPALGEPFDPNVHYAVAGESVKKREQVNTVIEVFQKGYRMGERILRHSMVKVGK